MGVDSFLVIKITRELESHFDALNNTLLFEYFTLNQLSDFLVSKYPDVLKTFFKNNQVKEILDNSESEVTASSLPLISEQSMDENIDQSINQSTNINTLPIPMLMTLSELQSLPDINTKVERLLQQYGNEGTVARASMRMTPFVFIESQQRCFYRLGIQGSTVFAWPYVGPEDYRELLVRELVEYALAQQWDLNILSTHKLHQVNQHMFTATPFGAIQEIPDIHQFTLKGSKKKKLRHAISRFEHLSQVTFEEYPIGSSRKVDGDIIDMIHQWSEHKGHVNPYIQDVVSEIESGCVSESHRFFITYIEQDLQNVIVITKMPNGYLMDMEFYPKHAPFGGLEYSIHQILNRLMEEDACQLFSLGGTYGPECGDLDYADLAIKAILDQIRETSDFSQGNFRFKNKFDTFNRPIYLCKLVDSDATSVTRLLMMIADPSNSNESLSLPQKERGVRQQLLEQSHYNVSQISADKVEWDLNTDSWAQLHEPFIDQRLHKLHQMIKDKDSSQMSLSLEKVLSNVFGMPYVVTATSGRIAESILTKALSSSISSSLQPLLFPTWLMNQLSQGIKIEEIPDERIFSHFNINEFQTETHNLFLGGLDLVKAEQWLKAHKNQNTMVCIELANNGAGGYPVSIEHMQAIKTLCETYNVFLVVDVTRLLDNVYWNRQEEPSKDIELYIKKLCRFADAVTGSLAKNWGINVGGFSAVKDHAVYQEMIANRTPNTQLSAEQAALIIASCQDISQLMMMVESRIENVQSLAARLLKQGIPVVGSPCGHCILLDVKEMPDFAHLAHPVASFTAWLYLETGIRCGLHSVGMQKNTSLNGSVRLAVPLGYGSDAVKLLGDKLIQALSNPENLLSLRLVNKNTAGFGQAHQQYARLSGRKNSAIDAMEESQVKTTQKATQETMTLDNSALEKNTVDEMALEEKNNSEFKQQPEIKQVSVDDDLPLTPMNSDKDIAIIGMAGQYPQAKNLEEFWNNLITARDCITTISDERLALLGLEQLTLEERKGIYGGYLDGIEKFDESFFQIPNAEQIDPQERLFLETAWLAIEHAGYSPQELIRTLGDNNIGVYAGVVWSQYHMLSLENINGASSQEVTPKSSILSKSSLTSLSTLYGVANRVSHSMNFAGPSLVVNSACSSSLNALQLAYDALVNGQISAAVVGGVNLDLHHSKFQLLKQQGKLSNRKRCASFGAEGDGYITGEGVGAVLLKPLHKAIEDRDSIIGVIKSVVSNHSGVSSGYGVPNPNGQTASIKKALHNASISADDVSCLEAHGTGTQLGDSIEFLSLSHAFESSEPKTRFRKKCSLGSVKSNIGHLEAAAGMASLTKVLLQMQHQQLVPTLHAERSNEFIDIDDSPFNLQTQYLPWNLQGKDKHQPLTALINAFGDGGSNANVVVQNYFDVNRKKATEDFQDQDLFHFVPVSARSSKQLRGMVEALFQFIRSEIEFELQDFAYTLQTGRSVFEHRCLFVVKDKNALIDAMDEYLSENNTVSLSHDLPHQEFIHNWLNGKTVDWSFCYPDKKPYRMHLPGYSFDKKTHWHSYIQKNTVLNQPTYHSQTSFPSDVAMSSESIHQEDSKFNENTETIFSDEASLADTLVEVWQEVLNNQEISVDTLLISVPADSLQILKIVSKANQYSIALKPQWIYQCDTLKSLGQYVVKQSKTKVKTNHETDQKFEALNGRTETKHQKIPLGIGQRWMFDQNWINPHWMETFLFYEAPNHLEIPVFIDAVKAVIKRYDSLRSYFNQNEQSDWQRWICPIEDLDFSKTVLVHDVSHLSEKDQMDRVEKTLLAQVGTFNLSEPALIRIDIFDRGEEYSKVMHWSINHLIIDGYALSIVISDVAKFYEQKIGKKPTQLVVNSSNDVTSLSIEHYISSLMKRVNEKEMLDHFQFWVSLPWEKVSRLPVDYPQHQSENTIGSSQRIIESLSSDDTQRLLDGYAYQQGFSLLELIICGISDVIHKKYQQIYIPYTIIHSARTANVLDDMDLSSLVDLVAFQSLVFIKVNSKNDFESEIKNTVQQLRETPLEGLSYELLRYMHNDTEIRKILSDLPVPEIKINYLGHIRTDNPLMLKESDQGGIENTSKIDDIASQLFWIDEQNQRSYQFLITLLIVDDELKVLWEYSENLYDKETIQKLVDDFLAVLKKIAHLNNFTLSSDHKIDKKKSIQAV